jgi:hypothetical protein
LERKSVMMTAHVYPNGCRGSSAIPNGNLSANGGWTADGGPPANGGWTTNSHQPPSKVDGRTRRKANARRSAAEAVLWMQGELSVVPTQAAASAPFRVSKPYIRAAARLTEEQRTALLNGRSVPQFVTQVTPQKPRPLTDADLVAIAREVGTDRLLLAAMTAEAELMGRAMRLREAAI